jgi:Hypothetical glycosyl hydrolase family 15
VSTGSTDEMRRRPAAVRRVRRLAGISALAVLGGLLLVAYAGAHASRQSKQLVPVGGTGVSSLLEELSHIPQSARYSMLIVPTREAALAAKKPGRSLVYFAAPDVNTNWDAGVPYGQALAHGWLLKDGSGNLLKNLKFPNNYIGDVGNPAYQRAWLANVLRFLRRTHVDGVFIDDVLSDLTAMTGVEAAEYPTQQAWANAQLSFIRTVDKTLRAKGYYVLVNASAFVRGDPDSNTGATTVTWWKQLAPYVDGLMDESYAQNSDGSDTLRTTGPAWYQNWDSWQQLVQVAQSQGKDFVGVTYGPGNDLTALTYAKASFLLDWNGGDGAFVYIPTDGVDPSNAIWATNIGSPLGAKSQVGSGWMRRYTSGVALVNPSPDQTQSFDLGQPYLGPAGNLVESVTLAPTSAMILRSSQGR